MSTITAIQFDQFGEAKDVLHVNNSAPKPQITKDNQVLVRVKAAPINPSDRNFSTGAYKNEPKFPGTPGFEGAGIIEEIGSAVTNLKVGQRVHFRVFGGSWAQYAVVDATAIIPVPDSISFEVAAQLTINPLTVYGLIDDLGAQKGDFILQTAAASALGKILIRVAKLRGIKTINVVRRDSQIEELKQIGADYVINYEKEDLVQRVTEITNGGLKYAVDAVTGKLATLITKALSQGGTLILYGVLDRQSDFNPSPIDILRKVLTIKGFFLMAWERPNAHKVPAIYSELIELISTGKLPLEFKSFDVKTQFKEAYDHSLEPGKTDKTILLF